MSYPSCRNIILVACLAGTCVAYGQRLSYGVVGGVSTIEPEPESINESKRYIVGATVEFRIWNGFAVEGEFLYRRDGSKFDAIYGPSLGVLFNNDSTLLSVADRSRFNVFEIPVLGKYYFRRDSKLQPFILTGYTLRKALAESNAIFNVQNNSTGTVSEVKFKSSAWTGLDIGASFGAGVKYKLGPVSLSPQVRYTRWGSHPNIGFQKNQADVLVDITF
jgi:Outer membrane protein beta-barrel domain